MFLVGKGSVGTGSVGKSSVSKSNARTSHVAARSADDDMQEQVYTLVRERLQHALGAGGMWNVTLRKAGDTETLFGETVAERLAWDVAARLKPLATLETPALETPALEALTVETATVEAATVEAIFVTPVVGAFGPPARVRVVVPTTYVGPAEWSKYGPPTLESLVASVEAPLPHGVAEERARA